jgi:hypothetical protein
MRSCSSWQVRMMIRTSQSHPTPSPEEHGKHPYCRLHTSVVENLGPKFNTVEKETMSNHLPVTGIAEVEVEVAIVDA